MLEVEVLLDDSNEKEGREGDFELN